MNRLDRRGSGPWFWLALVVLVFSLYSLAVAGATADDCGEGVDKTWQVFPPEWECRPSTVFG